MPAEYVTVFTGQRDAPEVRGDFRDRHTDTHTTKYSLRMRAPRVNYVPVGVKYQMHNAVCNYTELEID